MKIIKLISSIVVVIALSIPCIYAQEYSLKEFFGIPFRATAQQIQEYMKAKKNGEIQSADANLISYKNCKFGYYDDCVVVFFLTKNQLFRGCVNFPMHKIPAIRRNSNGTVTMSSRDALGLQATMVYIMKNINTKYSDLKVTNSEIYEDIMREGISNTKVTYNDEVSEVLLCDREFANGDSIILNIAGVLGDMESNIWLKLYYCDSIMSLIESLNTQSDF